MLKRFLCVILTLIMVCPLFACNLFEHNYDRDYKQVVAVINPINEDGPNNKTFKYDGKNIYKYELMNILNTNTSTVQSRIQGGEEAKAVIESYLEQIIANELILIDVKRQIAFGQMTWLDGSDKANGDYTDTNRKMELTYSSIDSSISSIKTEILKERGYDAADFTDTTEEAAKEPTYPLPETGEDEDVKAEPQTKIYELDKARWPGYYGDEDDKSLGREAMRRFIANIKKSLENDLRVTKDDKAAFKKDDETINNIINTKGIEDVYPELYKTHYIDMMIGKSAEDQVRYEKIQKSIEDGVTVTDAEVKTKYNNLLSSQITAYKGNDLSAYNTAMKNDTTTILYHPSSKYFYVKHVLLPFSEAQTKRLTAYKESSAQPTPTQITAFKQSLVPETVVYPHKNGEDDKSNPKTVAQVFDEIRAAMASPMASKDIKTAERTFDEFIYKYNTDPGIFSKAKGYVEAVELGAGETETYMPEFTYIARDLYKNYKVGQMHSSYAVTDYGVHIMYFASKTTGTSYNPKTIGLYDYETPGEYKTIYEILKKELKTAKTNQAFTAWQNKTVSSYLNNEKTYESFERTYKDLYQA